MGLIVLLLFISYAIGSFYLGYSKSRKVRVLNEGRPISLDKYYGYYIAIWSVVPAIIIFSVISVFDGFFIKNYVLSDLYSLGIDSSEVELLFTQIENTRNGIKLFNSEDVLIVNAVSKLNYIENVFNVSLVIIILCSSSLMNIK